LVSYLTNYLSAFIVLPDQIMYAGFKIKISNFEIFVGFFVYVIFLPAVFIFDNESVGVRR
jgi:hypothetical protein